jgi:hypothetical protein
LLFPRLYARCPLVNALASHRGDMLNTSRFMTQALDCSGIYGEPVQRGTLPSQWPSFFVLKP